MLSTPRLYITMVTDMMSGTLAGASLWSMSASHVLSGSPARGMRRLDLQDLCDVWVQVRSTTRSHLESTTKGRSHFELNYSHPSVGNGQSISETETYL